LGQGLIWGIWLEQDVSGLENLPVLVVDDNRHACRLLTTILGAISQAEIKACTCPTEAYKILLDWQPGMIITDFQMRPVDGLAFARELRSNPKYGFQLKPILLMTGETPNRELVERVKAAGVDTMVTKPIVPETLLNRMLWSVEQARGRVGEAARHDSEKDVWVVD